MFHGPISCTFSVPNIIIAKAARKTELNDTKCCTELYYTTFYVHALTIFHIFHYTIFTLLYWLFIFHGVYLKMLIIIINYVITNLFITLTSRHFTYIITTTTTTTTSSSSSSSSSSSFKVNTKDLSSR